jgi:tetratricopeptide (TPR) repeat protein
MLKPAYLLLGIALVMVTPYGLRASHKRAVIANNYQSGNQISGHVFDTSGRPVEKLRVELLDEVDSVIQSTRTDSSGLFQFKSLSTGTFQVRVHTFGTNYVEPSPERVSIINFNQGQAGIRGFQFIQADFTLRTREEGAGTRNNGAVFAQDVPEPARKLFAEGVRLLEAKDDKQGLEAIKKSIEVFPNYFMALERLGTEYAKREKYLAADILLTKAVEINPRADQSLYWLGISQYKLNQTASAIATLKRVISLVPNSINASMALGIALYAEGKLNESEIQFKQTYKLAKSSGKNIPVVHLHLAQLYDKIKRYKDEASELELYLQEEPNDPETPTYRKAIESLQKKARQ